MHLILDQNLDVKLVLGNPSVGTPALTDWTAQDKREWFSLLDSHRDKFVLGLHEYFCGIAPSGFVGGYPDGSWSDGRANLHPNYEDRRNWPHDAAIIGQLWHCGRLMTVNAAARSFGFMPPRIVITEHGADDLADMHGWINQWQPSGGRQNIRAWKTLEFVWREILPGKSIEQAYFENIVYLNEAVYSHFPNVEAQLLFTWSSSQQWVDFDLSQAVTFQTALEQYTNAIPQPPPVVPNPTPIPTVPPLPPLKPLTETDINALNAWRGILVDEVSAKTAQIGLLDRILASVNK